MPHLIALSLALVALGLGAFFWAVGNGQFDNLGSAGWDAVIEEPLADAQRDARLDDHA